MNVILNVKPHASVSDVEPRPAMQTDALMATVTAPLFSEPALKNEPQWVLGHWSPIQGAQVYQPLGAIAMNISPWFRWLLHCLTKLHQQQGLLGQQCNGTTITF